MKPGYLGRPVAFTLILAYFFSFLIHIDGFESLNLEVDEIDPQQEYNNLLTEEIIIEVQKDATAIQTCADFSFHQPLKCMKHGCKWNPVTRECRHEPSHVNQRVKRDSKSKCFHFDASPRICGYNGCKYDVKQRKCLKSDGTDEPERAEAETPKPTKLEEKSKKEGTTYFRFMESPTPTYCSRFHGKPHACGFAGCSFDKWSHRCGLGGAKGRSMGSAEEGGDKGGDEGWDEGGDEGDEEGGVAVEDSVGSKGRSLSGALSCAKFNKDKEQCVASRVNCLYNGTSEECIEAKEPPTTGDKSRKYCDFLYGKKNNCNKAGCSHDKKTKKCSSSKEESSDELDTVSVTYIVMQSKSKRRGAEECSELDGCPRGCLFAGCKFNEETNKCTERQTGVISIGTDLSATDIGSKYLTTDECSKINGTDRPCKNAGCSYVEGNKTCVSAIRTRTSDKCDSSDDAPIQCIEDDCLYDKNSKACFENDFQEFSYTITYVRVRSISKRLVAKQCSELDGSSAGCNCAGCKYDESAKKCLEVAEGNENDTDTGSSKGNTSLTHSECTVFNNKLRACGYAGCRYKTKGQKCIVISEKTGCGALDGDEEACDEAGCLYDKTKFICKDNSTDTVVTTVVTNTTKTKGKIGGRSLAGDVSGEEGGESGESGEGGKGGDEGTVIKGEGEEGGKGGEGSSSEEGTSIKDGTHSHSEAHCNKSNGKKKACIAEGCRYDKTKKTCSAKGAGHDSHEGGSDEHQDCSTHDEEPVQCADAGCLYDEEEETCSRQKDKKSEHGKACAKHNGKRGPCIKAGCKYNKAKGTCCGHHQEESESTEEETRTTTTTKITRTKRKKLTSEECGKMDGNKKKCKSAGCSFKSSKCLEGKGKGKGQGRSLGGLNEGMSSDEVDCSVHNGNFKACLETESCSYNKETEKCSHGKKRGAAKECSCSSPPTNEECSELQGSPRVCKNAGCDYDDDSGKCWTDKKASEQTGTCCNENSKRGYGGLFYLFPISGSQGKDEWAQQLKDKVNNVIDAMKSDVS